MAFLWLLSCFTLTGASLGSGAPASDPELSITPRIINGMNARPGSWPWHVSLQTSSGIIFCGGSLISKSWVITAAHCNVTTSDLVVGGQYDLNSPEDSRQILKIAQIFIHPKFNMNAVYSDIALLKLEEAAHIHRTVSLVLLPSVDDHFPPGALCSVLGWGDTQLNSDKIPDTLQQAYVPLLSLSTCRKYWPRIITKSLICAGLQGSCSCRGDSGGSLSCMKSGVWTLVGVMSFASKTCPTNKPIVATRVSTFIPWVQNVLAHN
ncbi:PREDICTED: chymotrypsinogen B2-like [Condylura cristata]|uniref:chymotrypsinogen B2-like n=1 Tax=Condylura cristata TaxID=143302 RepID=UPI000642912F|nr:PREDICTED: chymotrypsinogen B2-like [Condylura cristata]